MSQTKTYVKISIAPLPLLAITAFLLLLKAFGVGISWLWAFSPLWLPLAGIGAILIFCMVAALIIAIGLFIHVVIEHYRN